MWTLTKDKCGFTTRYKLMFDKILSVYEWSFLQNITSDKVVLYFTGERKNSPVIDVSTFGCHSLYTLGVRFRPLYASPRVKYLNLDLVTAKALEEFCCNLWRSHDMTLSVTPFKSTVLSRLAVLHLENEISAFVSQTRLYEYTGASGEKTTNATNETIDIEALGEKSPLASLFYLPILITDQYTLGFVYKRQKLMLVIQDCNPLGSVVVQDSDVLVNDETWEENELFRQVFASLLGEYEGSPNNELVTAFRTSYTEMMNSNPLFGERRTDALMKIVAFMYRPRP